MKRRLAAILVGDVVGYSAMMEADEEGTAARMTDVDAVVQEKVKHVMAAFSKEWAMRSWLTSPAR
jgi:class 3 adenylate cyclase